MTTTTATTAATVAALRAAGCVAAEEEALELHAACAGDLELLSSLVSRRCAGEPLAWLTGSTVFCGERIVLRRGVYVPRWQSEPLVLEAARRLPASGTAVDLCTGSGAIAAVLARSRPSALVLATEIDPSAARCARANGVEVLEGDLDAPLPASLAGQVDVVTAVVPYVPTAALRLLARDVLAFEPLQALHGGAEGLDVLTRAVLAAARLLGAGGSMLLEVGPGQPDALAPLLEEAGFAEAELIDDEDGDLRGLAAVRHR